MPRVTPRFPCAVAAATLAVGMTLAGCTGGGTSTPTATPTATVSPTPSPTPSPTVDAGNPPERPEAMSTASAEGAAAAASYFVSLYPHVYATGDLTEWEALSGESCTFCSSTRDGATELQRAGQRIEGGAITIESAEGTEIDAGQWYSASLFATEAASVRFDSSGAVVKETPEQRHQIFVALSFADGAWVIDGVEVRAPQ